MTIKISNKLLDKMCTTKFGRVLIFLIALSRDED